MKLFITGFGPFLNNESNPSATLAEALRSLGYDATILPVGYQEVGDYISSLPEDAFLLSFGLAAARKEYAIERFAYNETHKTVGDVHGIIPEEGYLKKDGESRLETVLDVTALTRSLKNQGFPVYESDDPGRYLCNAIYYLGLDRLKGHALFVHLPGKEGGHDKEDDLSFAKALLNLLKSECGLA